MLEDFARHGLVDIATDYGIFLLAFNKRGLEHMKVAFAGEEPVGTDTAWVLNWQQTTPEGGVRIPRQPGIAPRPAGPAPRP